MKSQLQRELELDKMINIQESDGNWNYSEYMVGMLNGLYAAKACITDITPDFRRIPDKLLVDLCKFCVNIGKYRVIFKIEK